MGEAAAGLDGDHAGLLVADDEPFLRDAVAAYGPDVIHTQRGVGYTLRLPREPDVTDAPR